MQNSTQGRGAADASEEQPPAAAVAAPEEETATGNQRRVTSSGGVRSGTKTIPAGRTQRSFYVDAEALGQARAAIINAGHLHGFRNLSNLVDQLLQDWVAEQQVQHNGGRPWPIEETERPLPRGPALR